MGPFSATSAGATMLCEAKKSNSSGNIIINYTHIMEARKVAVRSSWNFVYHVGTSDQFVHEITSCIMFPNEWRLESRYLHHGREHDSYLDTLVLATLVYATNITIKDPWTICFLQK
jgi:hypothetical protein